MLSSLAEEMDNVAAQELLDEVAHDLELRREKASARQFVAP
jgi:hypothetical protein